MLKRVACILMAGTYLAGCASAQRVEPDARPETVVREGDVVKLVMRNGGKKTFKVASVTQKSVCDWGRCVDFEDVAAIERHEMAKSGVRGPAIAGGIALIVVGLLIPYALGVGIAHTLAP